MYIASDMVQFLFIPYDPVVKTALPQFTWKRMPTVIFNAVDISFGG